MEKVLMHINDVYALREQLSRVLAGEAVDRRVVRALLEAAVDEVNEFEHHLHELALKEEAQQC